jgi:hypothetical protein
VILKHMVTIMMMKRACGANRLWMLLASFALVASAEAGKVFRVDDSGSQPITANAQLKWKNDIPVGPDANQAEIAMRVNIKLNTQPWQGRSGRIYMVLPPLASGQLKVTWTTQGKLQAGLLNSGGRGLVYQGAISSAMIEDIMTVHFSGDGRYISVPTRLQFYFEIELN